MNRKRVLAVNQLTGSYKIKMIRAVRVCALTYGFTRRVCLVTGDVPVSISSRGFGFSTRIRCCARSSSPSIDRLPLGRDSRRKAPTPLLDGVR